jgi:hypothetical protein
VGSVSEKVKEEETKDYDGKDFLKKSITLSWILKDPKFGKNQLESEESTLVDTTEVDRMINKFYS